MELEVRRGSDRFASTYDGIVSRHSFSFGAHYDPDNIAFGALLSHNEDTLDPHHGYDEHPHADLEIVTWVLDGALEHRSSVSGGDSALLEPGTVQVLGAGSGVTHSEIAGAVSTTFVQLWISPGETGLDPRVVRERLEMSAGAEWAWVPGIRNSRARVGLARLSQADAATLPQAQHSHLYVCSGSISLETGQTLVAGDTLRASQSGGLALTGVGDVLLVSAGPHG